MRYITTPAWETMLYGEDKKYRDLCERWNALCHRISQYKHEKVAQEIKDRIGADVCEMAQRGTDVAKKAEAMEAVLKVALEVVK